MQTAVVCSCMGFPLKKNKYYPFDNLINVAQRIQFDSAPDTAVVYYSPSRFHGFAMAGALPNLTCDRYFNKERFEVSKP